MPFFKSRAVNLLNFHYLFTSAAISGGGAFYAIWLLKAGLPLPGVLAALALVFAARFVMRLIVLPIAIRTGLKPLVIAGTLVMALVYVALAHVTGANMTLARLVLVSASADVLYWPTYHAYFAALGEEEHRGRHLGVREAASALIGVVSPLAFAALLVGLGPNAAFNFSAGIQLLAALPLAFTPPVTVARRAPGALRAALPGALLFLGDGLTQSGFVALWQLVLFLALSRDVLHYGGAQAVAALAGAIGGLVLGRWIDAGAGRRAVWLAIAAMSVVILLRAGAPMHPVLAVAANTLGALASCLYTPTLMTAMYNQSKRSPDAMRFQLVAEGGWDVGAIIGLLAMAALMALGLAPSATILVSLAGLALGFVLLRRYYAKSL
jgi:DHA1 family inner membrane transport protein